MKFELRYCNTGTYVDPVNAIELVPAGEAGGVDDFPLPDPSIWVAYVASSTTSIKLATGILILGI